MAIPYPTDPSLPSNPAPLFSDLAAARGDHLRANNAEIWANFTEINDHAMRYDYIVDSQAKFDAIFTGTIPENTSIFLKKKSTPYLLNYAVVLSSGVKITSDGAVVNRNSATARFSTTYKNTATYSSGGAIGANTVTVGSHTPFIAGDIISWNGKEFYSIISDTGTLITLSSAIKNNAATGTLYSYTQNIETDDWIFDGQNNVNGLGGSFTSGFTGNGGAFLIEYCANSEFKAIVRNCKVTVNGGGYSGSHKTFLNIIRNVNNCSAEMGGGLAFCDYCEISEISFCACGTTGEGFGGGCHSCSYGKISNVYSCVAQGSSGGYGGGCNGCEYSTITKINSCSATSRGGGCYACNFSEISYILNCVATSGGGGCDLCTNIFLSGIFNNEGTVDNIGDCSYMGQLTYVNNSGVDTHVQTSGTALATTDLH